MPMTHTAIYDLSFRYMIGSGDIGGLIDFYRSRGQLEEALIVAKASEDGRFHETQEETTLTGGGASHERTGVSEVGPSTSRAVGGGAASSTRAVNNVKCKCWRLPPCFTESCVPG